jgi:hypothetical protein
VGSLSRLLGWIDLKNDLGDGVLILAPAEIPKSLFVEELPAALLAEVVEHNRTHRRQENMRLRLAVHAGEVNIDDHGGTGASIIHTIRILDADSVKVEFSARRTAPLVIICSDWFFKEVVQHSEESSTRAYPPRAWIRLMRPRKKRI